MVKHQAELVEEQKKTTQAVKVGTMSLWLALVLLVAFLMFLGVTINVRNWGDFLFGTRF